jgi:nucleoside-diphosphate-sugar epimerase
MACGTAPRAPRPAPGTPFAPTRIHIIGATGGTGRGLVANAQERGYEVTVLVRNLSKLAIKHARLRVLKGDVLDFAPVEQAVCGQDAVVSAHGHKRFLGPSSILSEGAPNLIQAMEAHGVGRLVCETSLGIGSSAGRMGLQYTLFVVPVILPFYFCDKTGQERLIAASSLDRVIVRPGALTDQPGRGGLRAAPHRGDLKTPQKKPHKELPTLIERHS